MAGLSTLSEIQVLEAEANRLRAALAQAEKALRAARQAAATFQRGEVVEAKRRYPGGPEFQEAIVREIEVPNYSGGYTWYRVSFRRKNGEWANQVINVFGDVRAVGSGA